MEAARAQALTRPEVHGLSGVPDIDRAVIEGVQTEVLALDAASLAPAGAAPMAQTFLSGSHLFNWTRLTAHLRH